MGGVLEEICKAKLKHVAARKQVLPLEEIRAKLPENTRPFRFEAALRVDREKGGYGLIAEIKKASPSKGLIAANFDPVRQARFYCEKDASCISILTDTPYFQGEDSHLTAVRAAVDKPLLRKDFMVDPYQIYESRMLGADCILIIMAALPTYQAKELATIAYDLGMSVLVEVHDEAEIEAALPLHPSLIGVNARNLKTMDVSLETSCRLLEQLPQDTFKIAESGITSAEDLDMLIQAGFDGFLIGESLMRGTHADAIFSRLHIDIVSEQI
ncbi:MAG: indole-3-glycerol phosphate synthase TrpC [Pseudobdellovibrionaceae bacterium]